MADPEQRERESQSSGEDKFHEARDDEREERARRAGELPELEEQPE